MSGRYQRRISKRRLNNLARDQHLKANRALAAGLASEAITPAGIVDTHSAAVRAASKDKGVTLFCMGWDNGREGATKTFETTDDTARLIFGSLFRIVEKRDENALREFLAGLRIPLEVAPPGE